MSTELELYNPLRDFDPEALPAITADLSPVQLGYVAIGLAKENISRNLQKAELDIQAQATATKQILCNGTLPEMEKNLKIIGDNLALMKSADKTAKDERMQFTGFITDKVISPLMEFEKRNKNEIDKVIEHEFTQRKIVSVKQNAANAQIAEESAYKAHITNQYFIQGETHRKELQQHTLDAYKIALTKPFPKNIAKYKSDLAGQLGAKEMSYKFVRFPRVLVDDELASKIIDSIEKYKPEADIKAAIENIETVFAMYDHDKANASKAVAAIEEEKKEVEQKANETITAEVTTNNLMAEAVVGSFSTTAQIKVKVEVVTENTPAFALAVLNSFIKNWSDASAQLRVKDWKNLKIEQMATALAAIATERRTTSIEAGKVFAGLTLKHIEK